MKIYMGKYPKQLLEYRYMESGLRETDLVKNLRFLHKIYLEEKELFNQNKKSRFGYNLYTEQAIEIFREILIHSGNNKIKSLGDSNNFNIIFNHYLNVKKILRINKTKKLKKESKIKELFFSIGHKQFWYQKLEDPMINHLNYYLNYYKNEVFNNNIKEKIGIDIERLLLIGIINYNLFNNHFYVDLDSKENIFKNEIKTFIDNYSIDIFSLREKIIEENKKSRIFSDYDELINYGLIEIFDKPLLKIGKYYTCIFPVLFINRITTALYYLFINDKIIGNINQKFILDLFLNLEKKYSVINTDIYKKDYKRNIPKNPDIILDAKEYKIFFECKTNSISYESVKNGLTKTDIEKIKKNIKQIYGAIIAYEKLKEGDNYFGIDYISNSKIILIISYIKSPYLGFGGYLDNIINELIKENEITKEIVDKFPIKFIENTDVLFLINIIDNLGIEKFYEVINSKKYDGYELEAFIIDIIKEKDIKLEYNYKYNIFDLLKKEGNKYKPD